MPLARVTRLTALELGQLCLDHLVDDPNELMRFMSVSGYSPDGLREAIKSPALSRGLIEYVAAYEPLMIAICTKVSVRPEDFMRVYYKLNPEG